MDGQFQRVQGRLPGACFRVALVGVFKRPFSPKSPPPAGGPAISPISYNYPLWPMVISGICAYCLMV